MSTFVEARVVRDASGRFADKFADSSGQLGLAEQEAPAWFGHDLRRFDDATPSQVLDDLDTAALRTWRADGDWPKTPTDLDDVPEDVLRLAIRSKEPGKPAGDDVSPDDADRYFESICTEAVRLHAVEHAITGGHPVRTGKHEVTGARHSEERADVAYVSKELRTRDFPTAQREGLLPPGRITVRSSRFAGGASVNATLYLPEQDVYEHDPAIGDRYRPTQYSQDVKAVMQRILDSRNRRDVDMGSDYWNVDYYGSANVRSEQR